MTRPVILVPGTFADERDWHTNDSPFWLFLEAHGFAPVCFRGWDGNVDGLVDPLENGKHASWKAGGWALADRLALTPAPVIAHSHGGNVAAYACGLAQARIPALITVCTPVRRDLRDIYAFARPRIGQWTHVYAQGFDFWQRAGAFLDGQIDLFRKREMAAAHVNVGIPKIGHTGLLEDTRHFHWWSDAGLLGILEEAGV